MKIYLFILFFIFALAPFALGATLSLSVVKDEIAAQSASINDPMLKALYVQHHYKPFWIHKDAKAKESLAIRMLQSPFFNYKEKPFLSKELKRIYWLLDNRHISQDEIVKSMAAIDIALTKGFVEMLHFLVAGDVDWALVKKKLQALKKDEKIKAVWEFRPKAPPSRELIYTLLTSDDLATKIEPLIPLASRYRLLAQIYLRYRHMEEFPKIPYANITLKKGHNFKRIKLIKKRLQITGDYPKNAPLDTKFDTTLTKAVATFQKRYNLEVTGTIDKITTYYLNKPLKEHIKQLRINLDKTKLYPHKLPDTRIEVNLPEYKLHYYEESRLRLKMPVVVGRIDRPTPLFNDQMDHIVLNPTWTIPRSLIKKDLIPVLLENPNYLKEHNITAYLGSKRVNPVPKLLQELLDQNRSIPYHFVQQPGEFNALGKVKFMFPNHYAVYLHDTNNKALFSHRYRVYSSGCVRVSRPFDLLMMLMHYAVKGLNAEELSEILASNKPKTLKLKQKIPVYMLYFTIFRDEGLDHFFHDIYLYDKMIYESSQGHKKTTFSIPKERLIKVKKQRNLLSN